MMQTCLRSANGQELDSAKDVCCLKHAYVIRVDANHVLSLSVQEKVSG